MPEICRFYGIIIRIFFNDHNPPHFHAEYDEHKIVIRIHDLSILAGEFPPKAMALVIEWAYTHQKKLFDSWNAAKDGIILKIDPLD